MMKAYLDKLDQDVSPIVGYGGVIIAFILAFVALDSLRTHNAALRTQSVTAHQDLMSLEQIQSERVWEDRLAQSREARNLARDAQWSGQTPGLIAASLQQSLRAIANEAKLKSLRIRVEPDIDNLNGLDVLYFELRGIVDSGEIITDILADIAAEPRLIILQDSNFSLQTQRPSQITLSGIIPVRVEPQQDAAP